MAPTPQKPSTAGKGSIGMKHSRLSKKKLHQKAVKAAFTQPDGERLSRKKRQKGRKQLSTLYRDIVDISEKLKLWDDSDEEDNMDDYSKAEKRLVIKAESIIGDRTLWKDNLEMKNSFRLSDDNLDVEDLLVLLGSIRHRQLTLALSCFNVTKMKTGEDKIKHFRDTVEMIKNDFEGTDFDDVLNGLPGLRRIHDSLHRELFEGRVSDAVHFSNNEREIAKYNSESNVSKYNSEGNVAKYNSKSNVAKYNSETVTSKSTVACTMMRSDCPVDADTQARLLELTRLMYTSYSSPNRSQSNQPYQYSPTPLPYPPQYGSAPHRSNGQHGAMNYPSPPY